MRRTVITGARVLQGDGFLQTAVSVAEGRILEVGDHVEAGDADTLIRADGALLSPGLVDIHVHGGGGFSAMSDQAGDILGMARAHARFGTTSLLPTTLAAPAADILCAVRAIRAAASVQTDGANILGAHLEGPCLSPKQSGAQAPGALLIPAEADLSPLLDAWPEGIRMMGAAPELPGGMELGDELARRGIVATIAHSDATYAEAREAAEHGYSDVTHLYSCCSTVHRENGYRISGVVEAGLNLDALTVQVIADGKHLPPELLQLIWRCKGADGIELITDGLEYAASAVEEGAGYRMRNGLETVYEDGVMKLPDRQAFAGSVATMNRCVRVMHAAGIPLAAALRMAAENPARRIGASRKGRIAAGMDADLVLFDDDMNAKQVMIGGKMLAAVPSDAMP